MGRWKTAQITVTPSKFRRNFFSFISSIFSFQDECYKRSLLPQRTALVFCLAPPQGLNLDFHILQHSPRKPRSGFPNPGLSSRESRAESIAFGNATWPAPSPRSQIPLGPKFPSVPAPALGEGPEGAEAALGMPQTLENLAKKNPSPGYARPRPFEL